MNKILLYFKIRKFYNIFAEEVGECFITKLSDMTADNVHDVLFDINEALEGYSPYDDWGTFDWLTHLYSLIYKFCENNKYPIVLNDIMCSLCKTHCQLAFKLARWLCKKGVI